MLRSRPWRWPLAVILVGIVAVYQVIGGSGATHRGYVDPALSADLAGLAEGHPVLAIATVDEEQSDQQTVAAAMRTVGLEAAAFRHLPEVAVLLQSLRDVDAAARTTGIIGIYANQRLSFYDTAIGAPRPAVHSGTHPSVNSAPAGPGSTISRAAYTASDGGQGVGVAVVDTGIDATHPDLSLGSQVLQNVKVNDADMATSASPVTYVENVPDTDPTSGHGTHVAGIVAGSGRASGGRFRGVAPQARLVGLSVGEGDSILDALGAFDYILQNQTRYDIQVVNASWGPTSNTNFDPGDAINTATAALAASGITAVFAVGNNGPNASDCSSAANCLINPWSVAPWVVGVADGIADGQHINVTSSRGDPTNTFTVDGVDYPYQPTLVADGTDIVSTRAKGTGADGLLSAPEANYDIPTSLIANYLGMTGTSMAAPAVAGTVALMQAAHRRGHSSLLAPSVVRQLLQQSAVAMTGNDAYYGWPCGQTALMAKCGSPAGGTTGQAYQAWQVGAGYLDVDSAVQAATAAH
jgi:serine protease AprX